MSFERRPKRIAGPGFHVNVRYDDATVAQMRSNMTSNAKIKTARSSEVYDVKEMELLVTKKDSAMYYDGYTHCFSCVNGYPNTVGLGEEALKSKILDDVRFVGVAVTEYKPSKAYSEQGFVSQIGGVVTLLNESSGTIFPGEKVKLGLELQYGRHITRDKGIPREKVRFCIQKADDEVDTIIKALGDAGMTLDDLNCEGGDTYWSNEKVNAWATAATNAANAKNTGDRKTTSKRLEELRKEFEERNKPSATAAAAVVAGGTAFGPIAPSSCKNLAKFLKAYRAQNELIIGKALGLAKPGDRVEVLLQPRHSY